MTRRLVSLCVVLLSIAAFAQTTPAGDHATREDVVKLMEVMRCREMITTTMDSMMTQMLPAMNDRIKQKDPTVSDAELADLDQLLRDYMKQFPFDAMFDAMIPAYEKNLTATEVKAMIDFYSSPTGQSVLAKLPAISADAMKQMQPELMKAMDGMETFMDKKMAELRTKYPHKKPAATQN